MVIMPHKKDDKKGTKTTSNSSSDDQTFEYVIYQSNILETSLVLLDTNEDAIVVKVLDKLIKFCNKNPNNRNRLIELNVLDLLPNLVKRESIIILKLTLKLTTLLIEDEKCVKILSEDKEKVFIKCLTEFYTTHKDPIVQELSLFLLLKLIGNEETLELLVKRGVLGHVFRILKETKDPDIQFNSLQFLNKLLDAPQSKYILQETEEYDPKLLLCYNKTHPIQEVQDLSLDILNKISEYKQNALQVKFAENKIVEAMLDIITDSEKEIYHACATSILMNSMQCEATAFNFLDSIEFLKFLEFIKTCPKEFILPASKIIYNLTTFTETHQILNDFSAEDGLLSLFRLNDPMVHFYVCSAIKNLTQHKYMCERILTPVSLKCILDLLKQRNLPEKFHDMALATVYAFLKTNYRTLALLHKIGLEVITDLFLHERDNMKEENWFILLDIIHMFCCRCQFSQSFLFREMYKNLLELAQSSNIKVASQAIIIMNCFANESKAVEYFLDHDGPAIMVKALGTTSEKLLKDILVFLHNIIIHNKICSAFLKERLYIVLESIHENIKEENPLMYRIIEKLENMYLPLKFHHKGRLEVEDKLKSGFYLVNGVWKGTFPFLEILEKQSISTFYTIYVVDYSFGQKSDQVDMVSSDITDIWDLYSLSDPVSHLIKYGRISPDPFLNNLIHIAGTGMYLTAEEDTLSCSQKARSLAKFVERQTSGIILDATPEQYTHYYKYHISCLKRKLGTNIIPIGYVRSGKHCERALLFKALADKIGLPATLIRGKNGIYWNEIPTVMNPDQLEIAGIKNSYMTYAIIDLMDNVGQLLLPGSREAKKYCKWD